MMLGNEFVKILEKIKKSLVMGIVDTILLSVHVITLEEHLVLVHLWWDQPNYFFWISKRIWSSGAMRIIIH